MGEPLGFVDLFCGLLRTARVRFAIRSGMACVYYGLQQTTKDTDWIVDPADLSNLRRLLYQQQQRLPPWRISYRTVFGAPLDVEWMRHGWTSHILIQHEALGAEQHLDFFARPPRVSTWSPNADGFADRDVVARMKRTDRERDWPYVDSLGWQIMETGGGAQQALLHVQDAGRLRQIWERATVAERSAAAQRRPVLQRIDAESDPDRLEGWIRLERLVWQCINRERYGRYQQAWKDFFRRWRQEADWVWPTGERFLLQHQRLVAAAKRHGLQPDPLAGLDAGQLLELALRRAAAMSFAPLEHVRSVAPGPTEVLT